MNGKKDDFPRFVVERSDERRKSAYGAPPYLTSEGLDRRMHPATESVSSHCATVLPEETIEVREIEHVEIDVFAA